MNPQSIFQPLGVEAGRILSLWWPMLAGAAAVMVLVAGLLLYALLRAPARRARINTTWFTVAGGVVLPVVTLSALLAVTLWMTGDLRAARPDALHVQVIGRQWWWELRYLGDSPHERVVGATELHLPAGRDVRLSIDSGDVIHSFWVPKLAGKIDAIPGVPNAITVRADTPGRARGQCAEFCGAQHANMVMELVVHPPAQFERWLAGQRLPARAPADPQARAGHDLFMRSGCVACHTVRGTAARGTVGPDLTHLASRRLIAGGMLENNRANLAAWVTHAQSLKPGSRMPDMTQFTGEELHALVAWLRTLE